MTDHHSLDELLRAEDGDPGCDAGEPILTEYVEIELAGGDPSGPFPGMASHLSSCPACRADHDGLLEAVRRFGDLSPD
jgi:hypothetical protein